MSDVHAIPTLEDVTQRVREAAKTSDAATSADVVDAANLAHAWITAAWTSEWVTDDDLRLCASIPATALDAILARNRRVSPLGE